MKLDQKNEKNQVAATFFEIQPEIIFLKSLGPILISEIQLHTGDLDFLAPIIFQAKNRTFRCSGAVGATES